MIHRGFKMDSRMLSTNKFSFVDFNLIKTDISVPAIVSIKAERKALVGDVFTHQHSPLYPFPKGLPAHVNASTY